MNGLCEVKRYQELVQLSVQCAFTPETNSLQFTFLDLFLSSLATLSSLCFILVLRRDRTEVRADKQQMNSFCALIDFWGQWGLHRPVFPYPQSNSAYGMETFTSSSRNGMITVFIFPGDCARLITMVPAVHWLLATTFCCRRFLVALTPLLGARKCKGPLMLLLSYLGRRVNVGVVNHFLLFASWLAVVC